MTVRWAVWVGWLPVALAPVLVGVDSCGVDEIKDVTVTTGTGDDDDDDDDDAAGDDDDDTTPVGDDDDDDTTPVGDDDDDDTTTTPAGEGCDGLSDVADGQLGTDVVMCIEATFEQRGFGWDSRACNDLEGALAIGFGPFSALWQDCQADEGFGDADCDAVLAACF